MYGKIGSFSLSVAVAVGLFGNLTSHAASQDDLLFSASFDKGVEAEIAAGERASNLQGAAVFADGKVGKGLVVGKPDQFVTWPSAGNLDPRRGTVVLWVKSVNWKFPDQCFHIFFESTPFLLVYAYRVDNPVWFWASREGYDGPTTVAGFSPSWAEGEWHHLAATWDGQDMKLYFDGEMKASAKTDYPLRAGERFSVGPQQAWPYDGKPGNEPLSVIDEFRIYKRPLTNAEVRALFDERSK